MMKKYTASQKKVELYDIGMGLSLMNVLTKNEDGKLDRVDTYIGAEGNGFSHVGYTQDLAQPGVFFTYSRYVRMMEANLDTYIKIFFDNIK